MEWPVINARDADAEIAAAQYPQIRLFMLAHPSLPAPQFDTPGFWAECRPSTIPEFSAVAYFFGRELYRRLHVPIGLINASQGGSSAEQWTPLDVLRTLPDFTQTAAHLDEARLAWPQQQREQAEKLAAWTKATMALDKGYQERWFDTTVDTTAWKTMELPRWMDGEIASYEGVVWFRREFDVPASLAACPLELSLGPVDDMDTTWVNGVQVGEMMGEGRYMLPRHYRLPAGLVHAGRNTVTVRVLNLAYGGGLTGYATELLLQSRTAPSTTLSLAGPWHYHIGFAMKDAPAYPSGSGSDPTLLFNGIIAPLARFPIRGVAWYRRGGQHWSCRAIPATVAHTHPRVARRLGPGRFSLSHRAVAEPGRHHAGAGGEQAGRAA